MDLPNKNAQYIQLLNKQNMALEKNISVLEQSLMNLEDMISSVARDASAMQRAMIEYLKEKEVIKDDDDIKLLKKFHMRNIAQLDQEIAARKAKRDEELK